MEFPEECIEWDGSRDKGGYGRKYLRTENGKVIKMLAHRWSYENAFGPIPKGLVIDHLCRNPPCINPVHMEAVTQKTNILRGNGYSGRNKRKTHCIKGHKFTKRNTYIRLRREGGRKCNICDYNRNKKRREKLRGQKIPQKLSIYTIEGNKG